MPTTYQFDNATPVDVPNAVIPVEQIHGPILLDCAGADEVWASCANSEAIESRLSAAHDPFPHPLYRYPDAGHNMGALLPYQPGFGLVSSGQGMNVGGITPLANSIADVQLLPKVISFLSTN